MRETIEEIIKLAVNAPSGHNSQPWKFSITSDTVSIWNLPDKDKTLFNYQQRGSLIAHGALLENICIIASERGYRGNITVFPEKQDPNLVAKITFQKTDERYPHQYLSSYILKRATNRKPYAVTPLKEEDKKVLESIIHSLGGGRFDISLTEDHQNIQRAAAALSVGDRLIFENFYIHQALFSNVNWTLKEEQQKREGLYVGTKELSLFERMMFKYFLNNWDVISKLERAGLSTKAALKRQKLYEQCSTIGILAASSDSPADFVKAGRILQRFWLTTTSLGISLQPVSVGLLYLGQWLQQEMPEKLTANQIKLVEEAYKNIIETFSIGEKIPVFAFRIGYSTPPTAKSLKKEPILVEHPNSSGNGVALSDVGIIFISPIIGLTQSLINTFRSLEEQGASIVGVDIFGDDYEKKSFWKILKLTILPGAHARRISFANSFPEHRIFDKIEDSLKQLVRQGKKKILLGGMSGGFIFAARVVQSPPDEEIKNHPVREWASHVTGLFGISPLIFYPQEIHRPPAHLELIHRNIKTLLIFGDKDNVIPPGTKENAESNSRKYNHIQTRILKGEEFNDKSVRHQFFGGKDFAKPLKNPFWHPQAEAYALKEIDNWLRTLPG